MLIESGQITAESLPDYGLIGELSLNGNLRPTNGILPMVIKAKEVGVKRIVVPAENEAEAKLISGIEVVGLRTLPQVIDLLAGRKVSIIKDDPAVEKAGKYEKDFSEVHGQDEIIEAVALGVAGGHNILMIGEPGCGNPAMPGEVSLAHNGVLFFDELPEFQRSALEALRQPMENKNVTIARVNGTHTYPANFMFVAAMNPCPCGYFPGKKCHCSDYEIRQYRRKISGPILDRIDIQKTVKPVGYFGMLNSPATYSSAALRELVSKAREIQIRRFAAYENVNSNSQMSASLIRDFCRLDSESEELLKSASSINGYSARVINKLLRVARTAADMRGAADIQKQDIARVLRCRDLDMENAGLYTV